MAHVALDVLPVSRSGAKTARLKEVYDVLNATFRSRELLLRFVTNKLNLPVCGRMFSEADTFVIWTLETMDIC